MTPCESFKSPGLWFLPRTWYYINTGHRFTMSSPWEPDLHHIYTLRGEPNTLRHIRLTQNKCRLNWNEEPATIVNAEILNLVFVLSCFAGGTSDKEPACHCWRCKRCGFNPCVRKISWRRAQPSSPVFLPEESPWTEEPPGYSLTWLKRLSMHAGCVQWSRYTSDVCCNYF